MEDLPDPRLAPRVRYDPELSSIPVELVDAASSVRVYPYGEGLFSSSGHELTCGLLGNGLSGRARQGLTPELLYCPLPVHQGWLWVDRRKNLHVGIPKLFRADVESQLMGLFDPCLDVWDAN